MSAVAFLRHQWLKMEKSQASEMFPKCMLNRLWHRNRSKWTSSFPWLGAAYVTKEGKRTFGLGCYTCYAADVQSQFGRFECRRWPMWKSLFEQHEKTRCHRIGIGTATARAEAPSDEHFAKTYLAARERSTTRPIHLIEHNP